MIAECPTCPVPGLSEIDRRKRLEKSGLDFDIIPTPDQLQQTVLFAKNLIEYIVEKMRPAFQEGQNTTEGISFSYSSVPVRELSVANKELVIDAFFR